MPYLRRRYMTSWNGRRSPEAGSNATTSPSRIASRGREAGVEQLDDVGELPGHPFQAAGVQLQLSVGGAVGLHPDAVVLVLGRAAARPAWPSTSAVLDSRWASIGRTGLPARTWIRSTAASPPLDQRRGDQAEVGADVVGPFQHRTGLAAAGVHLGERVQDGGGADPEAQLAGHGADQVAGLQRRRLAQQARQQRPACAPASPAPGRGGDLVQGVEHHLDLQARRSRRRPGRQQPLGGQAEVAGLPRAAPAPPRPARRRPGPTARAAIRSAKPMSTPAKSGAIFPWHSSATVGSSSAGVCSNSSARRSISSSRALARSRSRYASATDLVPHRHLRMSARHPTLRAPPAEVGGGRGADERAAVARPWR